jgi:hypothetical protein
MEQLDKECFQFLKFYLSKTRNTFNYLQTNNLGFPIWREKYFWDKEIKYLMLYQSNIMSRYSQVWLDILSEYIKKYISMREEEIIKYLEQYQDILPHYYIRFHNIHDNILWYIETEYEVKFKCLLKQWIEGMKG